MKNKYYKCPKCKGKGEVPEDKPMKSFGILSLGLTYIMERIMIQNIKCDLCNGKGYLKND